LYADSGEPLYRDPVVRLKKSLYGHPESGARWEAHLKRELTAEGWSEIPAWPGVYQHAATKAVLVCYVHDLLMVAADADTEKLWRAIEAHVEFRDGPEGIRRYLGAYHDWDQQPEAATHGVASVAAAGGDTEGEGSEVGWAASRHPLDLSNPDVKPDPAEYPDEKTEESSESGTASSTALAARGAPSSTAEAVRSAAAASTAPAAGTVTTMTVQMKEFLEKAVRDFLRDSGDKALRSVATPYLQEELAGDETEKAGAFASNAAQHLMRLLYAARVSRPDLMVGVTRLAHHVSRWKERHDRALRRLMAYVAATADLTLQGTLSTADSETVEVHLYPDADLAGEKSSSRSTSGLYAELAAPAAGHY